MVTPSEVGARAELEVATALARAGFAVYLPLLNGHGRVDLVFEGADGMLKRAQCKTSRLKDGCISFRTCSNTGNVPADYRGQIDVFAVYSPEMDAVYVVPVDDVGTRYGYLRVDKPRSSQQQGIRWAEPYRLDHLVARHSKADGHPPPRARTHRRPHHARRRLLVGARRLRT
ncbi:MAG: hypothetical protein H0W70_00820 [Actinobacteria bacterium]|nr:hypothetical protein [Actinomycetota bacterium]